jgi:Zn-dependent protease
MFTKRFTIFKLLGFEVKIDLSWLILAVLVTWSLAVGFFPSYIQGLSPEYYWWMGIAGTVGLLFSIIFHDLSHSVVARRLGLPMKGITLFIFGGVAEMEKQPASPRVELSKPCGSDGHAFLPGLSRNRRDVLRRPKMIPSSRIRPQ